jgi:uncharacterized membrane protein
MLLKISRFFQLLLTGLYTGILFGDRIGITPIRPKLPASAFVLFQQELHLRFGKLMPVLLFGSLIAGLISLVLMRSYYRTRGYLSTIIATFCTGAVVILTVLINVPINETLMTWNAASPPENVMQLWAPWEGSHSIRTVIAVLGFAALIYAATTRREANIDEFKI